MIQFLNYYFCSDSFSVCLSQKLQALKEELKILRAFKVGAMPARIFTHV